MRRPLVFLAGLTGSVIAGHLGIWWPATAALAIALIALATWRPVARALLAGPRGHHEPPVASGPPPTQPPRKPGP